MAFRSRLVTAAGPSLALQELLYGFIMALIFVNATLIGLLHYDDPMYFVIVVTGMNATWGAIDGIIFYCLGVLDQRRFSRLLKDDSVEREQRIEELMDEFSATPLDVMTDEDKRAVCERMLDRELQSQEEAMTDRMAMAKSSLACFLITILTLIPIVVPVLLISDFMLALEIAAVLSSLILFFVGFYMAPYLGLNRWLTGIVLTAVSLAVAVISTFTGG
ncbi:MAG: hypothetical protein E7Z64_00085 [Thermoplasmata archaeon]|nr:hypothetical protein [Thermoplasmata archaeon]